MTDVGQLRFLPWLRRGLAASIPEAAQPDWGARPSVAVTLNVRHDASVEAVSTTLRVYGPGDVIQLDPAQVIATEPKPFANAFEPNYLAAVVFDAPELPWLFSPDPTPSPANPSGRLRPWLCLVVVRREAAQIAADPRRPVPTLTLADAGGELPDLAESWAWAHAQVVGAAGLDATLVGPPERTLSRLICPRRLRPGTAYVACVVPTFAAGRQAGLGEEVTATVEPAWSSPAGGRVELPLYYSWEFATGPEGDFESLVRRLEPRALGPDVGLRLFDVSRPGPGLPQLEPEDPGSVLGLEGALRSPSMLPTDWPEGPRDEFQRRLEAQLQAPQGAAETTVTPPLYGSVQSGATSVAAQDAPAWLRELNLDPRHRAAAAFGVRVVQERQEQLVAAAWDQIGELDRANQLRREAQLARAAAGSLREKRLAHLPPRTLLRVTGPAHARIPAPPAAPASQGETLLGIVRASVFPEQAVSPPFRRALRPLGPLGRRVGADAPVSELVRRLAQGSVQVPIADAISGGVEHDEVGAQKLQQVTSGVPTALGWRLVSEFSEFAEVAPLAPAVAPEAPFTPEPLVHPATDGAAEPAPQPVEARALASRRIDDDLPGDVGEALPVRRRRLGGINGRFRAAARALQAYLGQPAAAAGAMAPPLPVDAIAAQLVGHGGRLDPELTVTQAVLPLVPAAAGDQSTGDPLAPVAVAPTFPQPMYESLRSLSQELLLPAANRIPADTVGVLEGNPRFIEAFMVGLNHELGREFLWRGLPADPRATYFRQFWDVRGRDPAASGPATDIPEIAAWLAANGLGANATRVGGRDMLVLLVRGELVRRYPTFTVYAVRAANPTTLGSEELYPEFRGLLDPDLLFVAFGLGLAQARGGGGDPGWFFVLQEQVTEPRFGFDEPSGGGPGDYGGVPQRWRDLTWGQLVPDATTFAALSHVPVEAPALNPRLRNLSLEGATWGLNAAHMAQIALQLPVRVAVHAAALLPTVDPAGTPVTAVRRSRGRIVEVGGVDPFGEPWRLTEEQAIAAIHASARRLYVERPVGDRLEVIVAKRRAREYLKTTADGDRPSNLLDLPELPR